MLFDYSGKKAFDILTNTANIYQPNLARILYESLTTTMDMAILSCVLGCYPLRRTIQVRLGPNPAVPRDGCPMARPSSWSRHNNS